MIPLILYVTDTHKRTSAAVEIESRLHIQIGVFSMKDFLLRFVSDPNFSPDLIIFDLESLKDPHVKIFETSRLISNLAMLGRNRKPPVLGVFVFEDSSPELIRDVMDTDIKGIVPVI